MSGLAGLKSADPGDDDGDDDDGGGGGGDGISLAFPYRLPESGESCAVLVEIGRDPTSGTRESEPVFKASPLAEEMVVLWRQLEILEGWHAG